MRIEIFQIKDEYRREYGFISYDEIIRRCGEVNMNLYKRVWAGNLEVNDIEDVFYIFNCSIPEDFCGHSLSLGDVVKYNGEMFYCDRFGFKKFEVSETKSKAETKYLKLSKTVRNAIKKAEEVAGNVEDDGTSNFDAMVLIVPRWNKKKVVEAIENAGARCYFNERCRGFEIFPPCGGQGNRRTAQAEAMYEIMKKEGYTAIVWYEID